jgi:hypothetical protein
MLRLYFVLAGLVLRVDYDLPYLKTTVTIREAYWKGAGIQRRIELWKKENETSIRGRASCLGPGAHLKKVQ